MKLSYPPFGRRLRGTTATLLSFAKDQSSGFDCPRKGNTRTSKTNTSLEILHEPTGELGKRIRVELESKTFFYIPQENARFYQNPFDKWTEACSAFMLWLLILKKLVDGQPCIAIIQHGEVFHLMRVMGAGVTALGEEFK